ncbi:MAG: PAS domain S-box protein [Saprospiraceae bacterium]|nr:PAS domain S-box protein [Saprospiraceae bacterium]
MDYTNIELVSKLGIIASTLSSITDLDTLSKSINEIVDSIVDVEYNGLYFLDPYSQKLKLYSAKGFSEEERQEAEATSWDRHPGWVFRSKEVLLISDTEKDKSGYSKDSKRSFKVRSRVWLPILSLDKAVGTFGMASIEPNSFSEEHVALVTFVCDLAGVVYNNIILKIAQESHNLQLQKSKVEFETLFESFPDAIFIHNFETITHINEAFLKLFGYKNKDQVIGQLFFNEIVYPEDKSIGQIILEYNNKQTTTFIPKIRLVKKNGTVFLSEIYVLLIFIDDKTHVQVTIRDITEREKIEEQLKKEEQKSLLLKQAEQVPGVIYQCKMKPNGKVTYPFVSGKMFDLIGGSPDSIIEGKDKLFGNIYPEDRQLFDESVSLAKEKLKNWSLDYRIVLSNNEIRWMRGNSKPILLPDNSIVWHGYITDITENKEAEEALLDSEKQISTLFEDAPDAIVVVDEMGKIIRWNPKAKLIFGWTKEEVVGTPMYEVITKEQYHLMFIEALNRIKSNSNSRILNNTHELSVLNKDREELTISFSISKMKRKDELFFICFISDISIRKNNEKKIKQALDEKDVLLKEIHHRVKNNMQVVTSLLSLQSSFFKQENIREMFLRSQYRIQSMGIVHEMLYQSEDVSRINFGNYLTRLITGLIEVMKGSNNNVKLKIDCPDIFLNLDTAIPLGLITNELITNALKYGIPNQESGKISLRMTSLDYPRFKLEIGDDGVGFPKDFNFKKSKSLGLMLVHKLIIQLKGQIKRLVNKKGSNYVIYFQEAD